jgi:3',5'-cyclic AMP phosphodiesterase CpdA
VSEPYVLAQLSDPHVGAIWVERDARELLAKTADWIKTRGPKPDLVVLCWPLQALGGR